MSPSTPPSLLPLLLLIASLFLGACASGGNAPPVLVGVGPSILPNFGVSASAALRLREGRSDGETFGGRVALWSEVEFTQQCYDDTDFTGGARDAAGDWTQLRAGVKFALPSDERRDWTLRTGLVWFEARGEPNIVNQPGNYLGGYLGLGFETALTEHLSAGPELAMLAAFRDGGDDFDLVPQITWRLLWHP
jgi:hypothetical protein